MRRLTAIAAAFLFLAPALAIAQDAGGAAKPDGAGDAAKAQPAAEKPDVLYDPGLLPEPVRQMRDKILEAALSGDPEKLRAVIQLNQTPPAFSFSDEGDPIEAMKTQSNDGKGLEIMAILAEVMEAGYVHVDKGTGQEMYVWPYFAQYPVDQLTPPQMIELFKIMTSFEYKEMQEFGAYNFYRTGIAPDGSWQFFVAGD